jgi:[acyl-carrier-protein] S-malonyltransferase
MGREVFEASAAARGVFEEADCVLGLPLARLCFEGSEEELRRTEIQQPAILATCVALLRALEERCEVAPAFLLGHSLGEYTALVAGGALSLGDALALVQARGRFMQECVPEGRGAMAAVLGCSGETVEAACRTVREQTGGVVEPANYNAPSQTVIAGETAAVEAAGGEARRQGARRVVPLDVSAPFHCRLMAPAAEKLAGELSRVRFQAPRVPVVTNVEATPNSDADRIPLLLQRQVTAPVRFEAGVRRIVADGVTRVLEVGPGRVLYGLVGRIDRSLARASVAGLPDLEAFAAGAS